MSEQQTAPINQYLQPVVERRKVLFLVWAAVVVLGVAAGLAAPVSYSSTAAILVYPSSGDPTKALETDDADIDMPTELRIATSQAVINLVVDRLAQDGIQADPQLLADSITAASTKESTVLDLTFVSTTPQLAATGANAFAQSYLDFRAELASSNKLSAESAINARIVLLQERLSAVENQLNAAVGGSRVVLASEKATIEADLAAQQIALGALSTPTIDATVIIDDAVPPTAPEGLGFLQILVGAIAGGLVSGVVAVYVLAAFADGAGAVGARPGATIEPKSEPPQQSPRRLQPRPQPQRQPQPTRQAVGSGADTAVVEGVGPTSDTGDEPVAAGTQPRTADGQASAQQHGTTPELAPVEPARPEPLQDRRTPDNHRRRADAEADPKSDDETKTKVDGPPPTPAMIVSGDMEPVLQYLQGIGASGSVATMVVGERDADSAATITLELADALHTLGARVLVVDAALQDRSLTTRLKLSARPGFVDVANGRTTLAAAAVPVGAGEGLDVLGVGQVPGDAAPAGRPTAQTPTIRAASFERLLNEARLVYHTILVTGGGLGSNAAIAELAPLTDGLIIGTDRPAGDLADPTLHDLLAELPMPTLELLSAPSIGGTAAKLSGSAAGM
ncbi:MAG: hypothetical protein AAF531_14810 [Actinomycetota bacterium]